MIYACSDVLNHNVLRPWWWTRKLCFVNLGNRPGRHKFLHIPTRHRLDIVGYWSWPFVQLPSSLLFPSFRLLLAVTHTSERASRVESTNRQNDKRRDVSEKSFSIKTVRWAGQVEVESKVCGFRRFAPTRWSFLNFPSPAKNSSIVTLPSAFGTIWARENTYGKD